MPIAKLVGNECYSIVNDYIGRPVLAFDKNGEKVWSCEYDIYGGLRNLKGNKSFIPFRQLGQYEDVETGLYYNRFRYYDCNTGTYISKDPISILGGLNVYAYVWDSNTLVDLFGLAPDVIIKLQSYVFTDTRIKGIHADIYIDKIKKTEALLSMDVNENLYWKRFGDLNVSKKESKLLDKVISNLINDKSLMKQAEKQLDLLIKDLEKDILYGTKGNMDIAKRNIKKYKKMKSKICN